MSRILGRRVLVTGANRGLGLEMVKQLLKNYQPEKIFASCRSPEQAAELNLLAREDNRVHVLQIDLNNTENFPKAVSEVNDATNGKGIHVLVNNAGMFSWGGQSLEEITMDMMLEFFRVNTLGAIFLTQAFLPLLINANADEKEPGLIVHLASRIGSISDNSSGGLYASRCSRAAINAATKSMSIDLKSKKLLVIAMNPGWVKTDQGGPSAKLTADDSVSGMLKCFNQVSEQQSGRLMQYNGDILEW